MARRLSTGVSSFINLVDFGNPTQFTEMTQFFRKLLDTGEVYYYIHAMGRHVARVRGVPGRKGYSYETECYHTDYLGSVWVISDDGGDVVWTERYRPFGSEEEQSGDLDNDYRFTGKAYDAEAGLYYFNARWYDPETGRFISEDPLWGSINDPQSLNRFAYCRNNPFRYTDPSGMVAMEEIGGYSITDVDGGHHHPAPDDGGSYWDGDGDRIAAAARMEMNNPAHNWDPSSLFAFDPSLGTWFYPNVQIFGISLARRWRCNEFVSYSYRLAGVAYPTVLRDDGYYYPVVADLADKDFAPNHLEYLNH